MVCLDTSFIIDILRGDTKAVALKKELEKNHEFQTIAVPTIIELLRGLHSVHLKTNEKQQIEAFLDAMTALPLDKESAIKAGNIEVELIRRGQTMEIGDVMIGAIALHYGEMLVTKNIKHFQRIKGLSIQGY